MSWRLRIASVCASGAIRVVRRLAPQAHADEPRRAIRFALEISDHWEMREFLHAWSEGDTSEWPDEDR